MARLSADPLLNGRLSPSPRSRRSDVFLHALRGAGRVVFVSHVNPDPDSLGSMAGLAHLTTTLLAKPVLLTQDGVIGRAENRTMIATLGLDLVPATQVQGRPGDVVVMVDSQPGTGRHTCPVAADPLVVVDHHVTPGNLSRVAVTDIRPELGACCTIVTEYLTEQRVPIPKSLATALFYGIETEVSGYPREAQPADDDALSKLYPIADHNALARIRNAPLPARHLEALALALTSAVRCDDLLFAWVNPLREPDQAAEVVDFLIRTDGVDWAVCGGVCGEKVVLSVRAAMANANAGELLRRVVGDLGSAGGHHRRAGGCIKVTPATDLTALRGELLARIRREFRLAGEPAPFLAGV
jgi:nanoRNase/pAp phosphatase (c-di-AMP/oligoRNAs hydrolase)